MRWLGTGELGGPTGAIVPSPDVAGGVLPVDLWTTRLRCPQIHRHRDHNSKAIFHLVAPDPITPYPPQIARNLMGIMPERKRSVVRAVGIRYALPQDNVA